MGRDHFTFFKSFRGAVANLDPEDRLACYEAIMDYALYGTIPESNGIAYAIFTMAKPILDRSNAKAEAGRRGGSNKQTASKQEANDKQTVSNPEADESNPEAIRIRNRNRSKEKDIGVGEGDRGSGEEPEKRKRFTPPSVEEVAAYCREKGYTISPEHFIDFYQSVGWKVGNKSMKDWKAAVRTWQSREPQRPKNNSDELDAFMLNIINGGNDGQTGDYENHIFDQGTVSTTF